MGEEGNPLTDRFSKMSGSIGCRTAAARELDRGGSGCWTRRRGACCRGERRPHAARGGRRSYEDYGSGPLGHAAEGLVSDAEPTPPKCAGADSPVPLGTLARAQSRVVVLVGPISLTSFIAPALLRTVQDVEAQSVRS